MSPLQRYQERIDNGRLAPDEAQAVAMSALQTLYERLDARPAQAGFLGRLRKTQPTAVPGLYLWGGVGRGKTCLMDLFASSLGDKRLRREHFHPFMLGVHAELQRVRGRPDPLPRVADTIAAQTRVLCLDEFQVWDVADAMILGGLLRALFARGVTLVATSNTAPRDLYRDGLQRSSFLPAIAEIERRMQVLELAPGDDYRLLHLERTGSFHTPLNARSAAMLTEAFARMAPNPVAGPVQIEVNGRPIRLRRAADKLAWAEFSELCDGPRSPADYLELARRYPCLIISRIPQLGDGENDQARRFIHLVDVLYDHNVNLIASAAAAPESLYSGSRLVFEFRRTVSRLQEMQSRRWLERPHLA